jgi:Tat protein translocase TatB subunit
MFNIGFSELVVIGVIALIFIGPKQLPEIARTVGKFINELKRASDEALGSFREASTKSDEFINKTREDLIKRLTLDEPVKTEHMEKPTEKSEEKSALASHPPKTGGDSSDF